MVSGAVEPVRVVVVDDDESFRHVTRAVLESEMRIAVVGEAADGEAAVALVEELAPDVVLMDLRMPGIGGVDATRRIADTPTAVLILTASDDDADLFESLRAGASGYLLKETSPEDLVEAVGAASRGEGRVSPAMASKLITEFLRMSREGDRAQPAGLDLSRRELEVLKFIAVGWGNRQIAEELCLSGHTVKRHVANILAKLHQRTRMDAALVALRAHLLGSQQP